MFTYTTQIRVNLEVLAQEVESLKRAYRSLDPTEELRKERSNSALKEVRSAFSRYNNLYHFYNRIIQNEGKNNIPIVKEFGDGSVLIDVKASAKGNSARVYFTPSVTSLTKEVRKAIVPINDGNVFVYSDIKAAEFALRCIQAGDHASVQTYEQGDDIYMTRSNLFPQGTSREIIKRTLIASMYGKTPYSTALDLGISEGAADYLLTNIEHNFRHLTELKRKIISVDRTKGGYYSPNGFDQTDLIKVADIDPVKGFNVNLAWSVYTQSALGFLMQKFSKILLKHQGSVNQTFLSIFDSVVVEINPNSYDRFVNFASKAMSPLKFDEFKVGRTMYKAMYE